MEIFSFGWVPRGDHSTHPGRQRAFWMVQIIRKLFFPEKVFLKSGPYKTLLDLDTLGRLDVLSGHHVTYNHPVLKIFSPIISLIISLSLSIVTTNYSEQQMQHMSIQNLRHIRERILQNSKQLKICHSETESPSASNDQNHQKKD